MTPLSKLRIHLTSAKYDTWLDFRGVRRKRRRALTSELRANLTAATNEVGIKQALLGVGSTRKLASEVTADENTEPNWALGFTAAATALALSMVILWMLSLYYAEGVLDSGFTGAVSSSLFPFFGSEVTINNAGGLAVEVQPGPLPFILAFVSFTGLAKPWRLLSGVGSNQISTL